MAYFAYNVGGWVKKEGKMCLRNKSMAPNTRDYKDFPVCTYTEKCNLLLTLVCSETAQFRQK